MASLTVVNIQNPDNFSGAALKLALKSQWNGKDKEDNPIEPSGKNGKFLLKDIKQCPIVQTYLENNKKEEEKKFEQFSSKASENEFKKLKISVKQYKEKGGLCSGIQRPNSITKSDIKIFLEKNTDLKKESKGTFTTKNMKEKIEKLGPALKNLALEYLSTHKGDYKSGKDWGKKEVEQAIQHAMDNL